MDADPTLPRSGRSRQADLLIVLLLLAIVSLLLWRTQQPTGEAPPAPARISARGRILELQQSVAALTTAPVRSLVSAAPIGEPSPGLALSWDSALAAILAEERGEQDAAKAWLNSIPTGEAGAAFQRCFAAAYLASASQPSRQDREAVRRALRSGYAAHLLEARLHTDPAEAARLRDEARRWALPRVGALAAAGLTLLLLVPVGIALGTVLVISPRSWCENPAPVIRLSGHDMALAILGWLLAFLLAGMLVAPLMASIPFLRPFLVPLTYGIHATIGFGLLSRLEGLTMAELWRRWTPGSHGRSLVWGLGFLALAGTMVLAVTLLLGPVLERQEAPQQQLMDLVADTKGVLPVASLFFTVALAAPLFEECLFRGWLLPWLGQRWRASLGPRLGWSLALVATSLGFGLIHLQPVALPVLSTLGLALGLAVLRTGSLLTAILVHGLWNGGVFLFYRLVLG